MKPSFRKRVGGNSSAARFFHRFPLRVIISLALGGILFENFHGRRYSDHDQVSNSKNVDDQLGVQEAYPLSTDLPFVKIQGQDPSSWRIVDWEAPITPEEGSKFNCVWGKFTSTSGKQAEMCLHPSPDTVSDVVRNKGRWMDCDLLPQMWKDSGADDASLYFEMGANIGACVLEMLLSTNATIVAFEPHPMNVFNLKSTVSRLDESTKRRLHLFPIGLGKKEDTLTIQSDHRNMGNSMIDKYMPDGGNHADEARQFDISVERLDDILDPKRLSQVRLTKIDVQGFECNILEGMGQEIASKIDAVKFEYSGRKLWAQECFDLMPRFRAYEFVIYRSYLNGIFNNTVVEENIPNGMLDLFATRKKSFHL